jgi:hypothetical protein
MMYTIPPPPNLCPEKKSLQCKLAKEKVEWRITTAPNAAEKLDRSRANRLARAEQCEPEPWVYRFEASPPWDAADHTNDDPGQAWPNDGGSSSGDQWSPTQHAAWHAVPPAYPPPGFDMRAPAGPPPGSPSITPCEL